MTKRIENWFKRRLGRCLINAQYQATPPDGNDFVAIVAGQNHSLGLKSDGSIAGWGFSTYGQASPPAGYDYVAMAAGLSRS